MSEATDIQPWRNDGTPQNRRFPDSLAPDYFRIDDRTPADYLRILAAMAEKLRLEGDVSWRKLLPDSETTTPIDDWQPYLARWEGRRDNPPHLALFITFLRLYRHAQDHLNSLTGAHLDHYYRQVLGFRPRPAKPDHLCVFPSLAKGVANHLLPAGTALDAGQDADGNPLVYATETEIVVTRARVASVKAIRVADGTPWLLAAPVADKQEELGAPFAKDELPQWPAFGPTVVDPSPDRHLGLGIAISSPLLFLKQGERKVLLFIKGDRNTDWTQWDVSLSAAGGWLRASDVSLTAGELTIEIAPAAPPIVAADPKLHPGIPHTGWPTLRLNAPSGIAREEYKRIAASRIERIVVTVDDFTSLQLSNDLGPLNADQPFQPFGPRPEVGSAFAFESDELEAKRAHIDKLHFDWLGKARRSVDPRDSEFALFSDELGTARLSGTQIELAGPVPHAFGHSTYPTRLADIATANAAVVARREGTIEPFPPEPYTPTLKSFAISYTAAQALADADIRIYHLHPFGIESVNSSASLLPAPPDSSSLFIGVADFDPGSPLHLHFAAIEGSGEILPGGLKPPKIAWHFLAANQWTGLPDSVEDGTDGLLQPGIVSFEPLLGAVKTNPLMPPGLHWIRASVKESPDAVCKLSGITAQAVRTILQLGDAVPVHLRAGSRGVLPAGSVGNLLVPHPAIASVAQPFTSHGGREAEDGRGFYTRVSERLRHRHRAITAWDFERLVLDAFPEIYKVLCVRSGPGEVRVVVVPRSVHASWYDPLQPRPAPALKDEIEAYLRSLSSGMAHVRVIDPDYEPLQVTCTATFRKGKSTTVCMALLVEDLKRFLTPWAYDDSEEIVFGGRIHQSVIQAFIDGRDYVENFTGFKLEQTSDAGTQPVAEAVARLPWSILVSARNHMIATHS